MVILFQCLQLLWDESRDRGSAWDVIDRAMAERMHPQTRLSTIERLCYGHPELTDLFTKVREGHQLVSETKAFKVIIVYSKIPFVSN